MQNNKKKCYCCGNILSCNDFYIDGIYINKNTPNKIFLCGFCHDILKNSKSTNIPQLRQNVLNKFIKSNFGITSLFQNKNLKETLNYLDKNNEFKFPVQKIKKRKIVSVMKLIIGITGTLIITNFSKYFNMNIFLSICLCLIFLLITLIGMSELRFIKIMKERKIC